MKQRDFMKALYRRFKGERSRIVNAYAEAEQRGEVERRRNSHGISAQNYASRLFSDGVRNSWLTEF